MLQALSDFISKVTRGEKIRIDGREAQWKKVSELTPGLMIAVPREEDIRHLGGGRLERSGSHDSREVEGSDVFWDEIVSIRRLAAEQVYDIEVEGTHNFVAGHYIDTRTGRTLTPTEEEILKKLSTALAGNPQDHDKDNQRERGFDKSQKPPINATHINHLKILQPIIRNMMDSARVKNTTGVFPMSNGPMKAAAAANPKKTWETEMQVSAQYDSSVLETLVHILEDIRKEYQNDHLITRVIDALPFIVYGGIFAHNTVGKALGVFNETGDQNILVASASGTTQFTVGRTGIVTAAQFQDQADTTYFLDPAATGTGLKLAGNIELTGGGSMSSTANNNITINAGSGTVIIGDGTGKLDAGTLDPPYTINGKKYATYVPSMVGIKEETTGTVETKVKSQKSKVKSEYPSAVIDFRDQEEGSDLWLFSKVTALKKHIGQMTVLLSPAANTRSWYEVDTVNLKLTIYSSRPTTVSYRLSAPRFDSDQWQNTRDEGSIGHVINDPDPAPSDGAGLAMDSQGYLDGVSLPLASQESVLQGKTTILSPLSDEPDDGVAVVLAPSQTFGIYNGVNNAVASFDSLGNATLSGSLTVSSVQADQASISGNLTVVNTLYADRIVTRFGDLDERLAELIEATRSSVIPDLVGDPALDSRLLRQGSSEASLRGNDTRDTVLDATSSALLALLSNYESGIMNYGEDGLLVDGTILIDQTGISTIADTLYLQPAKLGNLDIMGGTIVVNTAGDVVVNGNLAVTGVLGVNVISPLGNNLMIDLATASGSFGRYLVVNGDATISGKLETTELLTRKLSLIADTAATESSRAASFGESILLSGQTQLDILSTSITHNSLIFVTPTSPTDKTLYVLDKKKEKFTIGISSPSELPIRFNWWIIN